MFDNQLLFYFQNASAQAALQAAQALTGTQNAATPVPAPATPVTNGQDIQGGPNTVLRVIIEHMIYPISLDILHVVSRFYFAKISATLHISLHPVQTFIILS